MASQLDSLSEALEIYETRYSVPPPFIILFHSDFRRAAACGEPVETKYSLHYRGRCITEQHERLWQPLRQDSEFRSNRQ